jgi:hypothetical protein
MHQEDRDAIRRATFFISSIEGESADVLGGVGHDKFTPAGDDRTVAATTEILVASNFPWKGEPDEIARNLALGDLLNNLTRRLTVNGRVHAETVLASIGAIAGFAAQRALFAAETAEQPAMRGIHIATTKSGGKYFFGEPLNRARFPSSNADAYLRLWSLAAGGAIAAGLSESDLGGDLEGLPSLREHRPQAGAQELLKLFWPLATMCFQGELSGAVAKSGAVSQRWRPVIAAYAANRFIQDARSVLLPAEALIIVMETAIYASKLDPAVVEVTQSQLPKSDNPR